MFNIVQGRLGDELYKSDWALSGVVTTRNCEMRSFIAVNKSGATAWIQLYDTASGAPDGTADEYPLPANSVLSINDLRFRNGIYWQAVTAADGDTEIGGRDIKVRCDFHSGPIV